MMGRFAKLAARAHQKSGVTGVTRVTALEYKDNSVTPKVGPGVTGVTASGDAPSSAGHSVTPVTPLHDAGVTELPNQINAVTPVTPVTPDFEELSALIEFEAGIPRAWAEAFARLQLADRPAVYDATAWAALIDAAGAFLDRWASVADRLGWQPLDILAVDRLGLLSDMAAELARAA
jgi:hypothetical protein